MFCVCGYVLCHLSGDVKVAGFVYRQSKITTQVGPQQIVVKTTLDTYNALMHKVVYNGHTKGIVNTKLVRTLRVHEDV